MVFAEFTKASKSAVVGQYPNANKDGAKRTVREALHYKASDGTTATAYLVFNVTFQTGATPRSHLADIDYTEPEPDGIKDLKDTKELEDSSDIFNLSGQRISQMQKGINIIGGKKVLNNRVFR